MTDGKASQVMTDAAALKEALMEAHMALAAPVGDDGTLVRTGIYTHHLAALVEAARAHLATLPRTRMVNVWRIEYAERHHVTGDWLPCTDTWPTEEYIRRKEDDLRGRSDVACIRVTGPFQQEVPEA